MKIFDDAFLKFKVEKITRMRVNASYSCALIGMRWLFLFVLLMYLFYCLGVCSRGNCMCELYLVWIVNS